MDYIINLLKIGDEVLLIAQKKINDRCTTAVIIPKSNHELYQQFKKLASLNDIISGSEDNESFKPKLNELVAAFHPKLKTWHRGIVISFSKKESTIALCDQGTIIRTDRLKKLPNDFKYFVAYSGLCEITNSIEDLELLELFKPQKCLELVVTTHQDKIYKMAKIKNSEVFVKLSQWKPSVEEIGIKAVPLSTNDNVIISIVRDTKNIFVRPLNPQAQKSYNSVLQEVALHCNEELPLHRPPNFGELLAAKFGSNYYRAIVYEKINEEYKVSFVDFGNTTTVSPNDMKSLPESLKKVPCSVVRIGLKDVNDKIINNEAWRFLNDVASTKVKYQAVFVEGKLGEVILYPEEGRSLNSSLADIMKTSWEKNIEAGIIYPLGDKYMNNHLEYEKWHIGTSKELEVMVYDHGHSTIVAYDVNSENYKFSEEVMKDMMYDYYQKSHSYRPSVDELCITMHKGKVTRAVCYDSVMDDKVPLILVDHCSLLVLKEIKSIRQMMPEFMMYPVSVLICNIPALEGKSANDKLINFSKMILRINNRLKCKVIGEVEQEKYNIEVDKINEYLNMM